ncbi:MAG: LacI family transcriptional regulator [Chloroflexi bacterium]|nr:LacI family transcriptional regulator [Chloroflexota bacterium]
MKTGLKEIARRAGVSVSTVSRALNGSARVDPETRARIRAAMQRVNYRARTLPPEFSPPATRLLGLLMPEGMQALGLNTSVYGAVADAIRATAEAAGYGVTIGTYTNSAEIVTVGDRLLAQKNLDGAVLFRTRLADESFDWFRELELPFVVIGRLFERDPFHCVGVDNRRAGYLAAKHLIDLGHKRIAFVNGPREVAPTVLRLEGFRNALREAQLTPREDWLLESKYDPPLGAQLARQLVAAKDRPTAIIAANDRVAWAIMRALQEQGRAVPADVSVIGFDDAEESAHSSPPLTTVRIEWKQMAEIATQMLIEILQRRNISRIYVVLEPKVIVRASTAPPK